MGTRGRRAPRVDEGGRETPFFGQTGQHSVASPDRRSARQVRFAAQKQRRPVLRPEFAVEHAGIVGFGSLGPRRGLIGTE